MTPADTASANSCARPPSRRKRRGFNLVEAAIVLGVVGLVIGGIWVAASATTQNLKISQAANAVSQISQNVRQLWNGHAVPNTGDWQNLTAPTGVYNGVPGIVVPTIPLYDIGGLGPTAADPWGKAMQVDIAESGWPVASFPATTSIWFYDLSVADCIKLVSAVTSKYRNTTDLVYVAITNQSGSWNVTQSWSSFPVLPTATECQSVGHWTGFMFSL